MADGIAFFRRVIHWSSTRIPCSRMVYLVRLMIGKTLSYEVHNRSRTGSRSKHPLGN